MEDYYKEFERIYTRIFDEMKRQYLEIIASARDWKTAHNYFNDSVLNPLLADNGNKLMALGDKVAHNFLMEWNNRYQLNKLKDRPELFNELVIPLESTKRKEMVKLLGEQEGLARTISFLGSEYRKRDELPTMEKSNERYNEYQSPISWIGTNETEFVQFVYALYEADYVKHDEKEITKLVEDLAILLNFPLGKNWQVNLSTSIHKRNSDYSPQIFDNLKEAYSRLRSRKIEKNKKI